MRSAVPVPRRRREGAVNVFHPRRLAFPPPLRRVRWQAHLAALRAARLPGPWSVVHSHWIDPDAYAVSRWEGARGGLLVATIHGHAALGLGILGRPSHLIRRALHRMDHIVAVSSELKSILTEQFGVREDCVSVCFNGVDTHRFRLLDKEKARRRLGLALNRRLIVNVARLSPEKRHNLLLDAVKECPERSFHLHIIGQGPLSEEIKASIHQAGLENRVFLEGGVPHEHLPDWFAAADLFCLSSAHEGCPVVIHEALACGLPVVSTRVGAVPDLVGNETGLLSEPGDAGALAGALADGLHRSWNCKMISRAGTCHTWDALARHLLKLYHRLGAQPPGPN